MSLLDPNWKYTPANATDIRKTIAREKKRLAEQAKREQEDKQEAQQKVKPMRKVAGK